jgi:molybdopterin molybdotransferase
MSGAAAQIRVVGFVEALELVLRHSAAVHAPGIEPVVLLTSVGRVLAENIVADRDQPPFDRATRDGFAVRADEWSAGTKLRVVGQVRAGEIWRGGTMEADSALEIMTGAPVPAGADAVAMVEHAEESRSEVRAAAGRTLREGENVVPQGSEARRGDAVVAAGTVMGAAEIAMAATCGYAELAVRTRPTVAIVATGDELVEVEQTPGEQQIRNSNGYALAAMVVSAGGEARKLAIARDTREDVRGRIAEGRKSDLLLLSGGVSAGKYDLVEEVLAEFGAEFFFTGVRMQPGKPVVFGRVAKDSSRPSEGAENPMHLIGRHFSAGTNASKTNVGFCPGDVLSSLTPTSSARVSEAGTTPAAADSGGWTYFFGLPGNPVSTQVTFHCFVEPLLRAMCGAGALGPRFVQATLAEEVRGKAGLTRLLPAFLRHDLVRPEARLVGWQGSGDLAANARANCYAVLPDDKDLRPGDVITVLLR